MIRLAAIIVALMPSGLFAGCPPVEIPSRRTVAASPVGYVLLWRSPAELELMRPIVTAPVQVPVFREFVNGGFNSFGSFDLRSSNESAAERRLRSFEADGGRGTFIGLTDARQKVLGF